MTALLDFDRTYVDSEGRGFVMVAPEDVEGADVSDDEDDTPELTPAEVAQVADQHLPDVRSMAEMLARELRRFDLLVIADAQDRIGFRLRLEDAIRSFREELVEAAGSLVGTFESNT